MGSPRPDLERRRATRERMTIELNVFDCETRITELEAEKARLEENIGASRKRLAELDELIGGSDG